MKESWGWIKKMKNENEKKKGEDDWQNEKRGSGDRVDVVSAQVYLHVPPCSIHLITGALDV